MKLNFSYYIRYCLAILSGLLCNVSIAGIPVFSVTPNISAQTQLIQGQQGTAIFQVTNNTHYTLNNIALYDLPPGITQVTGAGIDYCSAPFNLAPNSSCLIKLNINSSQTGETIHGGPKVCYSSARPIYCSQPLQINQLNTHVSTGPIPQACLDNITNFNYELSQNFDTSTVNPGWGPTRNVLQLSPANPNLTACNNSTSAGISWQQNRIVAAANFWIAQKLNYCHHYNPDFNTPAASRNAGGSSGGYCNPVNDIMPGSVYYNQQARWNYNGTGSETADNWVNNNYMWYGMDCSNYTAFLYNFAFGTTFDSDTGYQAGQRSNGSQDNLSPNQQSGGNVLDNPNAAGSLVCNDNSLEVNHSCGSSGYISAINSSGTKVPGSVTVAQLAALPLHPGDLLYIAASNTPSPTTSEVTHVIMWTGKQVGYGTNDINPAQIAPDEECPMSDWSPKIGDWVITDSHYQGADYRVLTLCFYLNNLWGVRRVIA